MGDEIFEWPMRGAVKILYGDCRSAPQITSSHFEKRRLRNFVDGGGQCKEGEKKEDRTGWTLRQRPEKMSFAISELEGDSDGDR